MTVPEDRTTAAPRRFTIRTAAPADAEALIGLFNRAFHKQKDARTAAWKYFESPHGRSRTLLAEDAGATGGAYSYVYRRMTVRGAPFVGAQASDAMVDVEFRKRGIFTTLDDECARASAAEGVPVCIAVAGRQSMHGFLKNGWRAIGTWRTHFAVIDARRLLASRVPAPVAAILAPALNAALSSRRAPRALPAGFRALPVERFDARFDALWAQVAPALPIAAVRDAAYLNWRYVDTPTRKHRAVEVRRGDALAGFCVFEVGAGRGFLVDLLGADAAAEDAAVAAALAELRAAGCGLALLSTMPCARLAAALRRNGFLAHPRRKPFRTATPFIVRVLREDARPSPAELVDPTGWYLLDGDRDVEHVSPA